jgi:hypothetical protein
MKALDQPRNKLLGMTMYQSKSPATRTELQLLPDILQRIEDGEIRVPAFQREFVWSKSRVRQLFQSIYSGYPIGSILLLRTSNRSLKANLDSTPFPSSKVHYPTTFVIDGMQRLSTLYGALVHDQARQPGTIFALAFNLKKEEFQHIRSENLKPWRVRLSSLFSYDVFLNVQQSLIQHNDRELYGRFMHLYNVFHRHQIPVVTIEDRSLAEVADIFVKINRQGQRLSNSDFKRASSWIADHQTE